MKLLHLKILFIFALLIAGIHSTFAQSAPDSIYYEKVGIHHYFYQGENNISKAKAIEILKSNPLSGVFVKKAKTNAITGYALAVSGSALVIYTGIKNYTNKEKIDVPMISLGLGTAMISSLFFAAVPKNYYHAAEAYDSDLNRQSHIRPTLNIGLGSNGLGIFLRL